VQVASDPKAVSVAYIEAVGDKRLDELASLLHPRLEATIDDRTFNKDEWIAALHRLAPILERNVVRHTVVAGEQVSVSYDFVTDTPVGAVPSVEWLGIEDGQIRTIRLMFQTERWPEVMEELARRA
jgi:hypothetical protein